METHAVLTLYTHYYVFFVKGDTKINARKKYTRVFVVKAFLWIHMCTHCVCFIFYSHMGIKNLFFFNFLFFIRKNEIHVGASRFVPEFFVNILNHDTHTPFYYFLL